MALLRACRLMGSLRTALVVLVLAKWTQGAEASAGEAARGDETCQVPGGSDCDEGAEGAAAPGREIGEAAPATKEHLMLQSGRSAWFWRGKEVPTSTTMAASTSAASASACDPQLVSRRREAGTMCSCRRRSSLALEDAGTGQRCRGNTMKHHAAAVTEPPSENCQECLCIFDIDRTLTGKQSDTETCPGNKETNLYDEAYGGGKATLSALANRGINTTFCGKCLLGITSAGRGSGAESPWNAYVLKHILRGEKQDAFEQQHSETRAWSFGTKVRSPFVLGQGNKLKQNAVELIRRWYGERGQCIPSSNVFFFGDRTENIQPFKKRGFNSREISCGSRDRRLHFGMVGYCGARPEEIVRESGNVLCRSSHK